MKDVAGSIYRYAKTKFPKAEEGSLRVWWNPQIPGNTFEWPVSSLKEAANMLTMLASYDDFQFGENVKGDYSNAGGLMVYRGGEWEEWEDDEGDDFDDYCRKTAEEMVG